LLYSEGVRTGRITLEQMVALSSTNRPSFLASILAGTIAVGSDADVVTGSQLEASVRNEDQLANAKFSIFAGWSSPAGPSLRSVGAGGLRAARLLQRRAAANGASSIGKIHSYRVL